MKKIEKALPLATPALPGAAAPIDPPWRSMYEQAVYFLAGNYAAEQVREHQRWANDRGTCLTAEEIARIFEESARYMTERIQRTSKTDGAR